MNSSVFAYAWHNKQEIIGTLIGSLTFSASLLEDLTVYTRFLFAVISVISVAVTLVIQLRKLKNGKHKQTHKSERSDKE